MHGNGGKSERACGREKDGDREWGQREALVIQSVCQQIIKTILKDAKRSRERELLCCEAGVNCFSS